MFDDDPVDDSRFLPPPGFFPPASWYPPPQYVPEVRLPPGSVDLLHNEGGLRGAVAPGTSPGVPTSGMGLSSIFAGPSSESWARVGLEDTTRPRMGSSLLYGHTDVLAGSGLPALGLSDVIWHEGKIDAYSRHDPQFLDRDQNESDQGFEQRANNRAEIDAWNAGQFWFWVRDAFSNLSLHAHSYESGGGRGGATFVSSNPSGLRVGARRRRRRRSRRE